jgi:hypothetical protein
LICEKTSEVQSEKELIALVDEKWSIRS